MKTKLLILLIGIAFVGCEQTNAQVKWEKEFLNDYLMPTDSANAYFIGYILSTDVLRVGRGERTGFNRKFKMSYVNGLPEKGNPILLNDTLYVFNAGNKHGMHIYKEGYLQQAHYYFFKKDKYEFSHIWDFTKQFENQEGSYMIKYRKRRVYYRFKAYKGWGVEVVEKGRKW
jgi:hypothetical protein